MPQRNEAPDWATLEETVAAAAARLAELRKENRALERRVKKLEKELETAQESAGASSAGKLGEVRERLRRLEGDLASLLG